MMNPVQEVFEESQELVRLRMAQNLRPQRAGETDRKIEKLAIHAFKNQVGMLQNAPSVGRVLLSDLVRML